MRLAYCRLSWNVEVRGGQRGHSTFSCVPRPATRTQRWF